jgi:type II secretory pathway pseudopilin PulG
MKLRQRGISLLGLLVVGGVLAFLGVIGAQAVPMFIEYQSITKATKKAANEESTVQGVRSSFDKAANIDQINSIKGSDLEVTKNGDKVVVSFDYLREIHLGAMVYITFKFKGSTADR